MDPLSLLVLTAIGITLVMICAKDVRVVGQFEKNTSKLNPMKRRDIAYYRQRQKNEVFNALVQFFAEEAQRRGVTKKELAAALSKDPSQITRWLSAPCNFELDTLSDILLALDAEMDHRIVRFADRPKPWNRPIPRPEGCHNQTDPLPTCGRVDICAMPCHTVPHVEGRSDSGTA